MMSLALVGIGLVTLGMALVSIGQGRRVAVGDGRCFEHGKVMPHYQCAESEVWLDLLEGK